MAASIYSTVQGDSFDIIAYRLFGDEHLCDELMKANPDEIDTIFFDSGNAVNIPDIQKRPKQSDLPPWYGR